MSEGARGFPPPWNLPLLFGLLCRWIERGSILASNDEMDSAKWSIQMTKREAEGRCCNRTVWRQKFIFHCVRNLCGRRCKVWTRQRTRTKKPQETWSVGLGKRRTCGGLSVVQRRHWAGKINPKKQQQKQTAEGSDTKAPQESGSEKQRERMMYDR